MICHDAHWSPMPIRFPSDIHKFEGNLGKGPSDHVMKFHLWCSSNSLKDDSVQLHLFQCTLIEGISKWYIALDSSKYSYFNNLEMVSLNHLQLLVRHDVDTKLLSNFEKKKSVHISDQIQEWYHQNNLIKVKLPPTFFLEWFYKSLVPCVSKDVMNFRFVSK
jgi:hypothetical protein